MRHSGPPSGYTPWRCQAFHVALLGGAVLLYLAGIAFVLGHFIIKYW